MSVQASTSWSFTLSGVPAVIPNMLNVPIYPWFPDAHIAIVKKQKKAKTYRNNSEYIMFWAGSSSYRSVGGPTPYPEDQKLLDPKEPIFGGTFEAEGYNNGGSWMNSVFRKSDTYKKKHRKTKRLIGFYHAEDHWPKNVTDGFYAWKSMGVAISRDEGYTWRDMGQMITDSKSKPEVPQWGGTGDGSVIWHDVDKRWICYYSTAGRIHMAMSEDREGAPGTWLKYYEGEFTQPGLGGLETPIEGLQSVRGGNPSAHFNTYLGLWIIAYHSWSPGCIFMSSSIDAYVWSTPQQVLCSSKVGGRIWYPTIIGESNALVGQTARLYYASFQNSTTRDFMGEDISFIRLDRAVLAAEKPAVEELSSDHTTSAVTFDLSLAEEETSDLSSSSLRTTTTATIPSNTLTSDKLDTATSGSDTVATTSLTIIVMTMVFSAVFGSAFISQI